MALIAIEWHGTPLRKVPRIENVNFAQVDRNRGASKVADRNRVGRFVDAVFYRAELFDLTLHAGPLFGGE